MPMVAIAMSEWKTEKCLGNLARVVGEVYAFKYLTSRTTKHF
jgi:hypothetical protein